MEPTKMYLHLHEQVLFSFYLDSIFVPFVFVFFNYRFLYPYIRSRKKNCWLALSKSFIGHEASSEFKANLRSPFWKRSQSIIGDKYYGKP